MGDSRIAHLGSTEHIQPDWSRMVEPQDDGYDTEMLELLWMARHKGEKGDADHPHPDEATWLDGTVEVVTGPEPQGEYMIPADARDPILFEAEELFNTAWPEMCNQAKDLLRRLVVYTSPHVQSGRLASGCSCGPFGDTRVDMEISTTINGGIGTVEGVVHEMAHNKLKWMGISLYHWERHMENPEPTDDDIEAGKGNYLYESPIRKDKLRPLGACLSAHYSYLHVCEWLIRVGRHAGIEKVEQWIEYQMPRIKQGRDLVDDVVESTEEGHVFWAGWQEWAARLLAFKA